MPGVTGGGAPPTKYLGERIKQALSLVGVTEERVSDWLGGPCGCTERVRKLNAIDAWVRRVVGGKVERAREYLNEILGGD